MKIKKLAYEKKRNLAGFGFISIWLIGFLTFFIRPIVMAIRLSFGSFSVYSDGYEIISKGFKNYKQILFVDPDFVRDITESILGMVKDVPLIILISLLISVLLKNDFKGRTFFRAVFFIPVIVMTGAISGIVQGDTMVDMALSGSKTTNMFQALDLRSLLLNMELPIELVDMVFDAVNSLCNLIWKSGMQIILLLVGLNSISPSVYEASKIEGANAWDNFWKIEIPMVSPMILLCVIYSIIDTFVNSNNSLIKQITDLVNGAEFCQSSAMILVYSVVILVFVLVVYLILNRFVVEIGD